MGCNNQASREASTVVVGSLVSAPIATKQFMALVKSTWHKKKETVEDLKARKAPGAIMKQSSKTKAAKPLPEAGDKLSQCPQAPE